MTHTITLKITETGSQLSTEIYMDESWTDTEAILALLSEGLVEAFATISLDSPHVALAIASMPFVAGEDSKDAIRSIARGAAVRTLVQTLPQIPFRDALAGDRDVSDA